MVTDLLWPTRRIIFFPCLPRDTTFKVTRDAWWMSSKNLIYFTKPDLNRVTKQLRVGTIISGRWLIYAGGKNNSYLHLAQSECNWLLWFLYWPLEGSTIWAMFIIANLEISPSSWEAVSSSAQLCGAKRRPRNHHTGPRRLVIVQHFSGWLYIYIYIYMLIVIG